ncbi:hypothetical protein [Streptomyces sp. NPDC047108]|uniref:hypothetical protein n=1 Tax=Streptomyces sp. NPDC047108 TaxID=3155025 RepID=UPI0033F25BA8
MTARHLTAATALAACAAVLLSGCGGSEDSKPKDDKIAGAEKESATAPTASAPSDAKRPKITLPDDDIQIFEGRKTGDAKKDAVLADNEQLVRAIDAAIIKGDSNYKPVYFYATGDAAISSGDWIKSVVDDGYSVAGTIRFYKRDVTFREDGSARLTYCSDESKWFGKFRKSGKLDKTPAEKGSHVFYDTSLERNKRGVWQTTAITSERGAQQCKG